jgi:hypothetical protein
MYDNVSLLECVRALTCGVMQRCCGNQCQSEWKVSGCSHHSASKPPHLHCAPLQDCVSSNIQAGLTQEMPREVAVLAVDIRSYPSTGHLPTNKYTTCRMTAGMLVVAGSCSIID